MPARVLPTPLLSLAASGLNGIKSVDADNLSCMWTVFTKCAENLENGRRLENFSWRLWYREAHFFDEPVLPEPISFDRKSPPPPPIPSPPEVLSDDLSESVNSASEIDVHEGHVSDQPHDSTTTRSLESHVHTPSGLARRKSSPRRQNVKHLSPDSFKSLIESLEPPTTEAEKWKALKVKRDTETEDKPLQPTESVLPRSPSPAVPTDIPASRARTMSETHGSPNNASGRSLQRVSSSIVRGFTPEQPSISRRLAPIGPQAAEQAREPHRKPKFFIASSVSDSDEEDGPLNLKVVVKPGKSSLSPPAMKRAASNGSVKKTHFHEIVDTKILPEPPTEDSEDDDSAVVSDDEDDEWEDSQSDIGSVQEDEHMFDKREDTHLTSRPSMLSTLFKSKSDHNLPSQAFRATNGFVRTRASLAPSPRPQPLSPHPNGGPVGIPAPTQLAAADLFSQPIPASPRTTRRRMLASELSESLRRNLLWERQHRTMTNNNVAAIRRRHTSNDLARLKDYPEGLSAKETSRLDAFDSGDAVW